MTTRTTTPVISTVVTRPHSSNPLRTFLWTVASVICLATIVPTGAAQAQQYGGTVAVSGRTGEVMVGEPGNQSIPGIVYFYRPGEDGWRESRRLTISEEGDLPDGFGSAIATNPRLPIVIGARLWDGGRGAAVLYGFGRDDGTMGEITRLVPLVDGSPVGEDARFGSAAAASGGSVLVSAPGENDGAGVIYLFTRDRTGNWLQTSRVEAPEGVNRFGIRVALYGELALVAAPGSRERAASVHAFTIDPATGQLEDAGTLEPAGEPDLRSGFGSAIALRNDLALVGAPGASGTGQVFQYRYDADEGWTPAGTLSAFDPTVRAQFGAALALNDDDLWVGAPGAGQGAGRVYRFSTNPDGSWGSATKMAQDGLPERASFGSSIAVGRDRAVVGAGGIDSRAGGAVLLGRSAGADWADADGQLVVGDFRQPPAILGMEEEVECSENRVAGYECDNVNVISFLPLGEMGGVRGSRLNDIWGWTDPETGSEIAIVGRTDGTSFVDLTNPYSPRMLGDLPKTPGSRTSVWRDMKVFKDYAYIVADGAGEHGVQVFDMRRLRDVGAEPVTFEPDYLYDGIHSAHNIVINEETGFAYAVGNSGGGETCGGGLHMLDLSDPGQPAFAGCFAHANTGRRGTGYSHDAQCVVYHGPDEDYTGREICLGSNETHLSISDVTDKGNPISVASESYPNVAYTHQGWLTEDHRYFYMNDEGDEPQQLVAGTRTLIWDVTDLDEPIMVGEYIASTQDTDHNLYILGNLMYQSNYGAGLRVLDITNRTEPVEVGYLDIAPFAGSSWSNYPYFKSGVVAVTSTGDGLFIVRNTGRRNLIP